MPDLKETTLKIGRAAIGLFPTGSVVSEFFTTPKEKRLQSYLEAFDVLVQKLENMHDISAGNLAKRDDFLDVLYGTTHLWLVTSDSEKLKSIFSFLENVAVNPSADDGIDTIVLRTLRDLSGTHIFLMEKFAEHPRYTGTQEFSDIAGRRDYNPDWSIILNDLLNMGILGKEEGLSPKGKAILKRITITSDTGTKPDAP